MASAEVADYVRHVITEQTLPYGWLSAKAGRKMGTTGRLPP